ncbi:unnamed protein product [Closterium sp. NIES-64]|nr:unnamed protein product [Closterium sp. NIES-64]CAI5959663.1 unnamed protein product [Closterium sp. NIES-64]CAI5979171.1 unnamed protein product [Closterium sp. NIES-64]
MGRSPCVFDLDYLAIPAIARMLFLLHKARRPLGDHPYAMKALKDAKRILIQGNDTDCGVFVCMYLNGLVNTGFKTVFTWVSCNGVTSRTYRRGMRRDVASHAVGELFVQLYMEEVEVLPQPHARVDDDGCMLFPTEDEVRTDLAQLSPDRNSMEVDGVLLAAAVMSIASALGFTQDQLEAACAHELGTHGTGLLRRSSMGDRMREREAASSLLTRLLHNSPAPLPQPRPGKWEAGSPWGYLKEEDAAYAYAAGAFVIRRKDHFPKMMSLSDAEMAALEGAIVDDVRHLVQKRKWYRWREWRKAMDYIGVLPGTPFKPEPGAESPPTKAEAADSDTRDAEEDEDLVSEDDNGGEDTSTPPRDARDDRDGSSSSSRETTSNRRKAGTARSQEDARTARSGKRSRDPDLEDDEGREEPAATGPGPVSSDNNPNEALPRVNPRVDGDEDATQEEASDSAPVTRAEMTALRKMQMDTAATMARLETALLASLANHQAKKRKRDNARGECDRVNPRADVELTDPAVCAEVFTREQRVEDAQMSFYPSSAAKSAGLCAVIERLTPTFAALAMAADKACRADLNRTLSDWKTAAAGRVRDIALPKLGLFRDERDASSPWAAPRARSAARVQERLLLTLDGEGKAVNLVGFCLGGCNIMTHVWPDGCCADHFVISKWSEDRRGMPFASGAFAACARAAFRPRMVNGTLTLKLYHMAWLEHVVTDAIRFWDTRKGRLSNSAGVNAQIVDGLRECALVDVMAAIEQYQLQYDPTTSSWAWGRHGLRLSADGVERQEPAKQAHSESDG